MQGTRFDLVLLAIVAACGAIVALSALAGPDVVVADLLFGLVLLGGSVALLRTNKTSARRTFGRPT